MTSFDLTSFNQAVYLAQMGQKELANQQLRNLLPDNSADPNLWLWIAFTSSSLTTAETTINRAAQLDPANPNLAGARSWLVGEQNKLTPATSAAPPNSQQYSAYSDSPSVNFNANSFDPANPTPSYQQSSANFSQEGAWWGEQYQKTWNSSGGSKGESSRLASILKSMNALLPVWGWAALGIVVIIVVFLLVSLFTTRSTTIPDDGSYPGDLVLIQRVLAASNNFTSVKMVIATNPPDILSGTMIVVQPDRMFGDLTASGKRQVVILIGQNGYTSDNGRGWTRVNVSKAQIQKYFDFNQFTNIQIKSLAGSTFTILSDETYAGRTVGAFEIDTSNATSEEVKSFKGAVFHYQYDKIMGRLQHITVKYKDGAMDVNYLDYDSPNNKVEPPI